VRRIGGAVAEDVDRDDGPARVGEQVDPARCTPPVFERRAESVDENDGLISHPDNVQSTQRNDPRPKFRGPLL